MTNFMMKTFAEDVVKKLYKENGMNVAIRLAGVGSYLLSDDEEDAKESLGANFMEKHGLSALKNRSLDEIKIFREEVNKMLRDGINEGGYSYEDLFKQIVAYYWLNNADLSDPKYFFKFEDEKKNFIQFYAMLLWSDCGKANFGQYYMSGKENYDITSDVWLKKHFEWVKMLG